MRTKKVNRSFGGNLVMILFLVLLGAFTALPIVFSLVNSLKPTNELFIYPPRLWVAEPTWDNYLSLFRMQMTMSVPIERYIFNSLLVSVVATVGYILVAALAAYPMAKLRFSGRFILAQLVVWAILFRPEVTGIPQYVILSNLNLIDTPFSLIFTAMAGSFGVFLMRQFMSGIPDSLLESARMDGCSEYGVFWRIVMPMVKPAWLTLALFTFQSVWNTTGVQFIYSESKKMLPTALSQISTAGYARAGIASAVAVILMIPPIVLFLFTQGAVMETMAYSGLKD